MIGSEIHNFAKELWPLNRSLTGEGLRKTLSKIKNHLPDLILHSVPTGTKVFDWSHKLVSGNVNEISLDQIWNKEVNKLRLSHLNHEINKQSPCYNCHYLLGYQANEVLDGEEDRLKQFYL